LRSQYVQYGCGWCAPSAWENFDASPTLRFERIPLLGKIYTKNKNRFPVNVKYGDIVRGLPILADSCSAVYCSHVLEHLALQDFRVALLNTYKIVMPGGTYRLVLPDLEYLIGNYIRDLSKDAAINFMSTTLLGKETRPKGFKGMVFDWFGNSAHLWMWDFKSIEFELQKVGFKNIRRANFGDSSEMMFHDVEVSERWENCLGIECRK